MTDEPRYHELIDLTSELEKSLNEVREYLFYLFIFRDDGELLIEALFQNPHDINPEMVGGLIAAINGFAGGVKQGNIRNVVLQHVRFLFTSVSEFLVAISFDSTIEDELAEKLMRSFIACADLSVKHEVAQTEERELPDIAATALMKIFLLLDDKFTPYYKLGKVVELDLSLVEYEAEKRTQQLFEAYTQASSQDASVEETVIAEDLDEMEESPIYVDESVMSQEELVDQAKIQLENLLEQMVLRFDAILGLSVIRNDPIFGIDVTNKGNIDEEVHEKILSTLLANTNMIYTLLTGDLEERTLELEGNFMLIQKIGASSFMYIVFKDKDTIELLEPIVERIANTIASIYPDN